MSDTISVDVVGPSYWSYMATVMAECLDKFINENAVTPSELPEGVFFGAKEFFNLVLQAAGDTRPENPPASINAYVIAADALRGSSKPFPTTSQELRAKLVKYSELVDSLETPHALTEEEKVKTAKSLRDFFLRLAQDGEIEVYERSVQFEPLASAYRLY